MCVQSIQFWSKFNLKDWMSVQIAVYRLRWLRCVAVDHLRVPKFIHSFAAEPDVNQFVCMLEGVSPSSFCEVPSSFKEGRQTYAFETCSTYMRVLQWTDSICCNVRMAVCTIQGSSSILEIEQ